MKFKGHWWVGILKKRSFLIRLLLTTLLASCIPLTVLSVRQITSESRHILDSANAQLDEVTSSVTTSFNDFISEMNNTQIRLMLSPKFYESVLSSSVQSQIEALEQLKYYGVAIPFVKDFALINSVTDEVYALSGKYQLSGFSGFYLHFQQDAFQNLLYEYREKGGFSQTSETDKNLIYILPLRESISKGTSRYALFLITPITLSNGLRNVLPQGFELSTISYGESVIYQSANRSTTKNDSDNAYLSCTKTGSHGYSVTVQMDETVLLQNMDIIRKNASQLSIITIALCATLVGLVVFLNYRPLARLVSSIRNEEGTAYVAELDSILAGYRRVVEDKGRLTWQLYEKNIMIADRTMENLLSGHRVSSTDLQLLKLNMPVYRVVCAPLRLIENVTDIIGRNILGSPIYAIEMYDSGHLAFVCGQMDKSIESLKLLSTTIQQIIPQETIPLGFSAAIEAPEDLFIAYIGACRALETPSDSSDRMHFDTAGSSLPFPDNDSQEAEQLAQAIRDGDEEMIDYADRAFQRIIDDGSLLSTKRYACYQLVDLYRRIGNSIGLVLDIEPLALLLQDGSIQTIRDHFLAILNQSRIQFIENERATNTKMCTDLVQFVEEHLSDPLFSMNEIAEHLNVSIYTASRRFKNLVGISFRKYLIDLRIEHARDLLLTTDLPINEISEQSGFTSPSYFISVFKKAEGIAPGAFRKNADDNSNLSVS